MSKEKFFLIGQCLILLLLTTQVYAGDWYAGGTLHKKTAKEWHSSSYQNRLATSADFVATAASKSTQDKLFINNMTLLKKRSESQEKCISNATDDPELMSLKISEVAVSCIILLEFNQ